VGTEALILLNLLGKDLDVANEIAYILSIMNILSHHLFLLGSFFKLWSLKCDSEVASA